jgi:outer membrane lipoprotein
MKPTRSLFTAILLATLVISACTSIPVQLKGDYPALKPGDTGMSMLDTRVRWGGVILETRPEESHTCFEILSRELLTSMRPARTDQTQGRFIACKPGFYDPEVFKKEREVTLTGKIIHIDSRRVGEYDYRFPIVDIEFMTLWPVRREAVYVYTAYRPYYWHYPYYGAYWRYPY